VEWEKIYKVLTSVEHILLGIMTGVVGLKHGLMMVLLFTGYMLYQFSEAMGEKDYVSLREDILEYMAGYVAFTILYVLLQGVSIV
jgi:hypothetical protein